MELFDVCDEKGLPTGETVERTIAHREGIRHRTAHVWVIKKVDSKVQVLLQKRSMNKDSFPGRLDTSSAGHIQAGDEPLESALRELREELGILACPEDLDFAGQFHVKYEKEFHGAMFRDDEIANVYIYSKPVSIEDITVQKEELDSVEWHDFEETYAACKRHEEKYCVPVPGLEVLGRKLGLL